MISIKSTDGGAGFFPNVRRTGGTASGRVGPAKAERAETFGSVLRGTADTVEISRHGPESSGSVLKKTKENILTDINRDADPDALDGLKGLVASGNYVVNPDELARILSE